MARDKTNPARERLERDLQTGRLQGVYLLHGEEENLKATALKRIREAVLMGGMAEMNETVLSDPEADQLISACETVPFLAEKRLVVVRDARGMSGKANAAEGIEDYLPQVPEFCVLVFYVIGKADGKKSLPKKLAAVGQSVCFEVMYAGDAAGWVVDAFSRGGKQCSRQVAGHLCFLSGSDTAILQGEVEKIIAYVDERVEITLADVAACASRTADYKVYELVDAVAEGNSRLALHRLHALQRDGVSDTLILASLLSQYRVMQQLKVLSFEKVPRSEWGIRLGISNAYVLNKDITQAAHLAPAVPKKAVSLCLEAEYAFKSGTVSTSGLAETVLLKLLALQAGTVK